MVEGAQSDLGGLIVALPTPFDSAGDLDIDRLHALIEHYVGIGVEGIYCAGSTGEGLLLSLDERMQLAEESVKAASGRIPVISHVGTLTTRDSTELAIGAKASGVTAVSMIPPLYYSYGDGDLRKYYLDVAEASDMSMLVYDIPALSGVQMNVDLISDLFEHPRIIGAKHTNPNLYPAMQIMQRYPQKAMFNGLDEQYLPAMTAGMSGTIGTTVGLQFELFAEVTRALQADDLIRARYVQALIGQAISVLVEIGVFPAAKYLAGIRSGIDLSGCRLPLPELSEDDKGRLLELSSQIEKWISEIPGMPTRQGDDS